MSYKEIKKSMENYNNKYITDKEIIELMETEIEYYKQATERLTQIKELNKNISLNNIIEVNSHTILMFKTNTFFLKDKEIEEMEKALTDKLKCKCILINNNIYFDKVLQKQKEDIESQITTFYADGEVKKEERIYYK